MTHRGLEQGSGEPGAPAIRASTPCPQYWAVQRARLLRQLVVPIEVVRLVLVGRGEKSQDDENCVGWQLWKIGALERPKLRFITCLLLPVRCFWGHFGSVRLGDTGDAHEVHQKEPRALLVPAVLPVPPAPRAAPLSFRAIQRMIPALSGET